MATGDEEKENVQKNKFVKLFVATFIATFAFVILSVKYFLPDIDVEIGKDIQEEQTTEDNAKGSVDERLRWIQFEDNMPGVSTRFAKDNNEIQDKENKKDTVIEYDEQVSKKQTDSNKEQAKTENTVKKEVKPLSETQAPVANKISKVYVGQYSTIEQAIAMQNRLSDSELNLSPFVKKIGSHYVVQIGSYASAQKAQAVAAEIQNAGYAARVVGE